MPQDYAAWIGRQDIRADVMEPARCNALLAALARPAQLQLGDALPLLHHWLHFWTVLPPEELGSDGHPAKGGFLPPVPLPRRMWAGGRLTFKAPLHLGEVVTRTSTIRKVETKQGKSGTLVFVTLEHQLAGEDGLAIIEQQDLVYRDAATAPAALPAPADAPVEATWKTTINPDSVLLFRYSALTMNGHRIHYDRPYAMEEEAYPALVVHGPLQATLLAACAQDGLCKPLTEFSFRGQSPAFDGLPLHVCGNEAEGQAELWTQQGSNRCMVATAS